MASFKVTKASDIYENKDGLKKKIGTVKVGATVKGTVCDDKTWILVQSATPKSKTSGVCKGYMKAKDASNSSTVKDTSNTTEAIKPNNPDGLGVDNSLLSDDDDSSSSGSSSGSSSSSSSGGNSDLTSGFSKAEDNYMDDAFTMIYGSSLTQQQYQQNIENGLRVSNVRGIFGMPHQFLPNTDPRIDGSTDPDVFGRVYADKIVAPMPLMFMTPGTPSFMAGFSDSQRQTVLDQFVNMISGDDLSVLFNENSGKFYSLKYAYKEYFGYVNAMLRSAAFYLGIQDKKVNGSSLGETNWLYVSSGGSNDAFGNKGLRTILGPYAGAIPFYIDAETRVSDDFGNSTTQSTMMNTVDGLSDTAREIHYLLGNVGGIDSGDFFDSATAKDFGDLVQNTADTVDHLMGKGSIFSNIVNKASTLIAGGRMIFPELWSDSSFSRSYSCNLKLVSPAGDPLSIYLNILVPIYHLLGFMLPRASSGQTFYAPFLVRAYYKGIFNVDMGIITDMSISKGSDGEWTPDGLPTVAEVSFTIKDLYDNLSMSSMELDGSESILSNIAELDYIANSCGINIDEPEIGRTIEMYLTLGFKDRVKDFVTVDIFGGLSQKINQKRQNIFGTF